MGNTIVCESEITKIIDCEIKVIVLIIGFTKTVLRRNHGSSPARTQCCKLREHLYMQTINAYKCAVSYITEKKYLSEHLYNFKCANIINKLTYNQVQNRNQIKLLFQMTMFF